MYVFLGIIKHLIYGRAVILIFSKSLEPCKWKRPYLSISTEPLTAFYRQIQIPVLLRRDHRRRC